MQHARISPFGIIAALLVLLFAAGCGGGGDDDDDGDSDQDQEEEENEDALSLEDYFQEVESIGNEADEQAADIETLDQYLDFARQVADDFGDLSPPQEAEAEHEDYLDAIEGIVDEAQEIEDDEPGLTLEELSETETPEFDAAIEDVETACSALQDIADEEEIDVDLDCGGDSSSDSDSEEDGEGETFERDEDEEPTEEEDQSDSDDDDDSTTGGANDEIDQSTSITSLPFQDTVDTTAATVGADDPPFSCGSSDGNGATVWYVYEPDTTTQVFLDTTDSTYDTVIAAYEVQSSALPEVGCNDDFVSGDPTSSFVFEATAGQLYLIGVAAYGTTDGGTLQLLVDESRNNLIEHATIIDVDPFTDSVDTSDYTVSEGDPVPSCGSGQGGFTAWYRFTPDTDITLIVGTADSSYDTVLTVYQGAPGALTEVACNDDFEGDPVAGLFFSAVAGTTYYIEVSAYGTTVGGNLEFFAAE